ATIPLHGRAHLSVDDLDTPSAVAMLRQILAQDSKWLAQLAALEPGDSLPPAASAAEERVRRHWLGADQPGPSPTLTLPAQPRPALVEGLDVIVALYNQQDYIADCVASLLAEAPPEMRVLVVDDGATDDSVARLAPFGPAP